MAENDQWQPWETSPRDGSVFSVGIHTRYNALIGQFEHLLYEPNGDLVWVNNPMPFSQPTLWCAASRLPEKAPSEFSARVIIERQKPAIMQRVIMRLMSWSEK